MRTTSGTTSFPPMMQLKAAPKLREALAAAKPAKRETALAATAPSMELRFESPLPRLSADRYLEFGDSWKKYVEHRVTLEVLEQIVRDYGRPSIPLLSDDTILIDASTASDIWYEKLNSIKGRIGRDSKSVGRVEVSNLPYPYLGTAWVIDEELGIAVTNRHVAKLFSVVRNGPPRIAMGVSVFVNFAVQGAQDGRKRFAVEKVLHIATESGPDVAFLKLSTTSMIGSKPLPPALVLDKNSPQFEDVIVIGYPAGDPSYSDVDLRRTFARLEVKCAAPGIIMHMRRRELAHDCSTLGGCSGSPVISLTTGRVLGLHYSGLVHRANYAVTAGMVLEGLEVVKLSLRDGETASTGATESESAVIRESTALLDAMLRDCKGYSRDFLGTMFPIPLPAVTTPSKVARLKLGGTELRYVHYSAVMHSERHLPIFTATNIDGSNIHRIRRTGAEPWAYDPRLDTAYQIGNELYKNNDLDRGHLVRRLDPVWGNDERELETAERLTFMWTNCTPQHKVLNQQTWLSLEDYILNNAQIHEFRVSVFAGPVFNDEDPTYRGVQLPQAFWKAVVMVISDGDNEKRLSATGYLLSQANLLTRLEGFEFGEFATYQVSLAKIAKLAEVTFPATMMAVDPLRPTEEMLGAEEDWHVITAPEDIKLF